HAYDVVVFVSDTFYSIVHSLRPAHRSSDLAFRCTVRSAAGLGENVDGLRSGDAVAREQWGASSTAAGEVVPVCQDWQRIAVASGNVRRCVNYWRWVDRYHKAAFRCTVRSAAGLGVHIDGLRSGDQVAREQWGASSTAAGEVVPVCQDWQGIAVADGNVGMIVNYWCWVDRYHKAA